MNKQFLAVILVVIVGLFGVLVYTKDKGNSSSNNNSSGSSSQVTDHTQGAGTKNVTLMEYGDYQCPACKAYYPIVKELQKTYGDQIKFQFRNFPLVQIHQNAFIGARAAEAAGKQGKYFEMHDLLYEQQDTWTTAPDPTDTLVAFAKQLNLDEAKFRTDLSSQAVADSINADMKAGQDLGANSTPTFVLNGTKFDKNPTSVDEFKKLIDAEIAKSGN